MADIHATALAAFDPDSLRRYPVLDTATERMGAYLSLHPDEFALTPGSDAAVRLIIRKHARGGGPILLQEPNYAAWEQEAVAHGLTVHRATAPLADPAEQGTRLLSLANATEGGVIAVSVPNGLTGGCISDDDLAELARLAQERDHLLVIDACYQAFRGPVAGQLAKHGGRVLVVQSLSKSHGLAGGRLAVVAGDPGLIAQLAPDPLEHAVSSLTVAVALNAIAHHNDFTQIWSDIRTQRERSRAAIADHVLTTLPSEANFVTAVLPDEIRSGELTRLLSDNGYRVRDLSGLPGLTNCVRFTIGEASVCDPFIRTLTDALNRLGAPGHARTSA